MTPRVSKQNAIFIGTDTRTHDKMFLGLQWLNERNLHVMGPPGEGKSRLLLWLFQCLCSIRKATIIMVNPKGGLGRSARDWAMLNGHTRRVVWIDPRDRLIGYNPLLPNGLSVTTHTKSLREGIRAAWGQSSFDETAQLARCLYVAIGVARALELTIAQAVQVLRSGAAGRALRRKVLPALARNPDYAFFHEFLEWFNSRPERWQDQLSASCLARLEPFVADPVIARMLLQPRSINFGNLIAEHKIVFLNLEINQPLTEDDVRLLGRLAINDVVGHAFGRADKDRSPIYLMIDEAHMFMASDLCRALEMGRELGLHVILSHQDLDQLRQEDDSGKVYGAVMKCARVKCVFGDCHVEDLEVMIRDMMIDGFDPYKIKDQRDALELDPVETTRVSSTYGFSLGISRSRSSGTSAATARGCSHGESRQWGASHSHTDAMSMVHSSATSAGVTLGETVLPNGESIAVEHHTEGNTEVDASGTMKSDTYGLFQSAGKHDSTSETNIDGEQKSSASITSIGWSQSWTRSPFYEYRKRRNIISRTFQSEAEYLTECVQKAKAQPRGSFILKLPKRPAVFLRAPFVPDVQITHAQRERRLETVFSQPFYVPADAYQSDGSAVQLTGTGQQLLPAPLDSARGEPPDQPPEPDPFDWGS